VAPRFELVKVLNDRTITNLATRPTISIFAVCITVCTSVCTTTAGAPAAIRLAAPDLKRLRRVAPVALGQVEGGDCGIPTARDARDRAAQLAFGGWRLRVRLEVVPGTDVALWMTSLRVSTRWAQDALDGTGIWLVCVVCARLAHRLAFVDLMVSCES
jgi:hypothetical protein